jgi:arylsulfatase A-like enzyme
VRHRYADTVEAFYEEEDRRLGELLAMRSPDTAIMVLSDHGFEPADDPEIPGFHDDAPPGILVMQGPGIRAGIKLPRATVYDILPTLMASLDLPVARDLDGRILKQAFCPTVWKNEPPVMVASYGTGPYVPKVARPGALEDQLVDQLESLGYLD